MREHMTRVRGKFFAFLLLTALLFGICAFGACYEGIPYEREECDYQTITSAEQLFKMEETGAYRLAADIDLRGKNWTPKAVAAFDGGGHTIKNCVIATQSGNAAFFSEIRWLEDLTFENIIVRAANASCAAIAAARIGYGKDCYIKNVTVRGCDLGVTKLSTSDLFAGALFGYAPLTDFQMSDSRAEHCGIDLWYKGGDVYASALFGAGWEGLNDRVDRCSYSEVTIEHHDIGEER